MEFGLDGGYNRSYLKGIANTKGMNNFHLGFYFDFTIKNNWYFNTGVRVKSNAGATNLAVYKMGNEDLDSVMVNVYVTRKIGYFYVPFHLKFKFARHFFVQAGGQVGLRNKARDLFYNTLFEKDDVEFTNDIGDQVKRLDIGFSGGVGYKFQGTGMTLGATYYGGMIDIMKTEESTRNSTFYIYVYVTIGAGYKEAKQSKQKQQ